MKTVTSFGVAVIAATSFFSSGSVSASESPAMRMSGYELRAHVEYRSGATAATVRIVVEVPETSTTTTTTTPVPTTTVAPATTTTTVAELQSAPVNTVAVATTAVPVTTVASAPRDCAAEAAQSIAGLLSPHGIPVPAVTLDPSSPSKAYYQVGGGIVIRECDTSQSVLAHEVGHYVHYLANQRSWSAMVADSMTFCLGFDTSTGRCESGWLSDAGKTSEASAAPGVEHAAHCVGLALGVSGSYTKCPNSILVEQALARIASTST